MRRNDGNEGVAKKKKEVNLLTVKCMPMLTYTTSFNTYHC